jgi:hypothetical protein
MIHRQKMYAKNVVGVEKYLVPIVEEKELSIKI